MHSTSADIVFSYLPIYMTTNCSTAQHSPNLDIGHLKR